MPKRKLKGLPKADVEAIFGAFAAVEPEPKGELEYVNSFTLLVAVVLCFIGSNVRSDENEMVRFTHPTPFDKAPIVNV